MGHRHRVEHGDQAHQHSFPGGSSNSNGGPPPGSGLLPEDEDNGGEVLAELLDHIRECQCSNCDHFGYGNFLDYQIPPCPRDVPAVHPSVTRETSFNLAGVPPPAPAPPAHYLSYHTIGREFHPHHHHLPPLSPHHHQYVEYDSCSCSSSSETNRTTLKGPWCVCLVVSIVVVTLTAGLGVPLAMNPPSEPLTQEQRLDMVKKILKETPLIDGHNDLPWNLRKFVHNKLNSLNLSAITAEEPWAQSKWSQTDIPRMKEGRLGAQFWSAYVPCKAQHVDAVQITLEQIDVIKRLVEVNSEHLHLVHSAREIRNVHKQGRIASLIGVEGGHSVGNSLAVLRTLYNLGARYLTITHSCDTPWATGQDTVTKEGLSDFGKSVIKEMNRLGMIVDLSHSSIHTAKAAINISSAPVIFSHSGAYSLCNTSRNVPDDILKLVAHNGGIVMVSFFTHHVTCQANATISDVIKHINHIRAVAGIQHIGIGAGYDGINMTPTGLEDVSKYPYLFAELLADPDWTEEDVMLLAGENFLRVFEKVEEVRDKWKLAEVLPFEESGPKIDHSCQSHQAS